jgi:hypothetical protein
VHTSSVARAWQPRLEARTASSSYLHIMMISCWQCSTSVFWCHCNSTVLYVLTVRDTKSSVLAGHVQLLSLSRLSSKVCSTVLLSHNYPTTDVLVILNYKPHLSQLLGQLSSTVSPPKSLAIKKRG